TLPLTKISAGKYRLSKVTIVSTTNAERNLPSTISTSRTGEVYKRTKVPDERSSANSRIASSTAATVVVPLESRKKSNNTTEDSLAPPPRRRVLNNKPCRTKVAAAIM